MANVVIKDVPGLDGSYEMELGRFTLGELRIIKKEAGVRAGEIEDAMRAGDTDLLVAFALIALKRSGREVAPERLWEADSAGIELDLSDEEEVEATPLATVSDENRSE